MAIIRIYAGADGASHFEDIHPKFEPMGDQSESAELIPGSGIVIRRFESTRSNPWHHAPGRYATRCSRCPAPSTSRSAMAPSGGSGPATFSSLKI